ncbi:hypothetical protein FHP29_10915 [Nocardioides albidus]|uniref:Uncharacterized protein n=1 Tax=Nocardioides albidus TaxID=1517589 RepID=A0A5C4VVT2_9ACTN|nr:hypothetical protein [Nocardioides albidus]TNM39419.1 hypothetical protein FHP29_10915 [Nocardioides albidus]
MSDLSRLLRVELARYVHRRAVLVLLGACLVVPVLVGAMTLWDSRPVSADDHALAEARARAECMDRPRVHNDTAGSIDLGGLCLARVSERTEELLSRPPLDLDEEREGGSGPAVASLVAIALLLAGTTFTGHDWASRSVSNQLLFEPRRGRVWAAKAAVVSGAALVVAALVLSSYWLVLATVAEARETLRPGQLVDALQMGWRASGVAAAAALLGFAMTTLFRSTVATIGILLGFAVAGSLLLAGLGVSERWNPAMNLVALIDDGTTYYDDKCAYYDAGHPGDHSCAEVLSFTDAALYLGTIVGLVCVASDRSFRRRDVP